MGKPLHPIEDWARRMMESALRVPVTQHDDGTRDGMHDLEINYPGKPTGAVEVTVDVDGSALALSKVVYGREGAGRWIIPELRGGWTVSLYRRANGKRLIAELPSFLLLLEQINCREINTRDANPSNPHVRRALELGIEHVVQSDTSFPGSVYPVVALADQHSGGMVAPTADASARWIGDFLREPRRADVLTKLARSGAAERHAFVILAGLGEPSFAVFDPLTRSEVGLPAAAPDLPPDVTHVWLTTVWNGGRGLRWEPSVGWTWFVRDA